MALVSSPDHAPRVAGGAWSGDETNMALEIITPEEVGHVITSRD